MKHLKTYKLFEVFYLSSLVNSFYSTTSFPQESIDIIKDRLQELDDRGFRIDVSLPQKRLLPGEKLTPGSSMYLCVAICKSTQYADKDNKLWRQLGVDSNLIDDLLSMSYDLEDIGIKLASYYIQWEKESGGSINSVKGDHMDWGSTSDESRTIEVKS